MSNAKKVYLGSQVARAKERKYEYDFIGKTTADLTADGWVLVASPSINSYGIYGTNGRIYMDIDFGDAEKVTLVLTGTLASSTTFGNRLANQVPSQANNTTGQTGSTIKSGSSGTRSLYINNVSTAYTANIASGVRTQTSVFDLSAKTYLITTTGLANISGTLTDTQVNDIKTNSLKRYVTVNGNGSSYGLSHVSLTLE